jgi:hypothetical protein
MEGPSRDGRFRRFQPGLFWRAMAEPKVEMRLSRFRRRDMIDICYLCTANRLMRMRMP